MTTPLLHRERRSHPRGKALSDRELPVQSPASHTEDWRNTVRESCFRLGDTDIPPDIGTHAKHFRGYAQSGQSPPLWVKEIRTYS